MEALPSSDFRIYNVDPRDNSERAPGDALDAPGDHGEVAFRNAGALVSSRGEVRATRRRRRCAARDDDPPLPSGEAIAIRIAGILGFAVLFILACALAEGPCQFPQLSSVCEPIAERDLSRNGQEREWQAAIDRRVAELAPTRERDRAQPPVVVWHRPPRDDPTVETVVVALRAAGYDVKERDQTSTTLSASAPAPATWSSDPVAKV